MIDFEGEALQFRSERCEGHLPMNLGGQIKPLCPLCLTAFAEAMVKAGATEATRAGLSDAILSAMERRGRMKAIEEAVEVCERYLATEGDAFHALRQAAQEIRLLLAHKPQQD